ncbi:acylneuraminate cytidylyltransferase [Alphaproteobacteria bacterium]|nr:acylneuraminate cytidylyltransferase [Alphaproteobacteria bacterium]
MMQKIQMNKHRSLIIIPARGGSKGIPRKNIRPLAGYPLIYYAIKASQESNINSDIVVSTDDNEINTVATYFGVNVFMRPNYLGKDNITLDPVIEYCLKNIEKKNSTTYDFIFTVQPTCPLVLGADIDKAYQKLITSHADSIITVNEKRHLFWHRNVEKIQPFYNERLNRQDLSPTYEEVGAVIGCTRNQLLKGQRIGNNIEFLQLDEERSIDIDTIEDFIKCEAILNRKSIIMHVVGRADIGLGHVYRALTIANELVGHKIVFLISEQDDLALKLINSHNYKVIIYKNNKLLQAIINIRPDCIINDVLDTNEQFTKTIKEKKITQINFEDIGPGVKNVDLVINALYEEKQKSKDIFSGSDYVCLRDEFYWSNPITFKKEVKNLFICFGGTDPSNLTCRVVNALADMWQKYNIEINLICGPGYMFIEELKNINKIHKALNLKIIEDTNKISKYMVDADIAISASGRTVYELTALHIPTMVICANVRETTHNFANIENGIENLGFHENFSDEVLKIKFERLFIDYEYRLSLYKKIKKHNLKKGKYRVISKINHLLEDTKRRLYI